MREPQEKVPFDFILNKFSNMNTIEINKNSLVPYHQEKAAFCIKLMGIKYYIHHPDGETFTEYGSRVDSYVIKTILLRYLVNGKGAMPSGRYITFKEIRDGQVYYPNFYKRTIMRLARLYDDHPNIFKKPLSIPIKEHDKGDYSFSFEFLPHVIFLFVLYKRDEEFPANANILMDAAIQHYFNAEDLAVIVDVAIHFFVNKGKIQHGLGMYDMGRE
ncbi:MAG: DUF3786 domain-containing protein [Eubacteriales bacterium]